MLYLHISLWALLSLTYKATSTYCGVLGCVKVPLHCLETYKHQVQNAAAIMTSSAHSVQLLTRPMVRVVEGKYTFYRNKAPTPLMRYSSLLLAHS